VADEAAVAKLEPEDVLLDLHCAAVGGVVVDEGGAHDRNRIFDAGDEHRAAATPGGAVVHERDTVERGLSSAGPYPVGATVGWRMLAELAALDSQRVGVHEIGAAPENQCAVDLGRVARKAAVVDLEGLWKVIIVVEI